MVQRKRKACEHDENGFVGGYMAAKQAKLIGQFHEQATKNTEKISDIFKGVAIFVNGHTKPNAEELKIIMAENGGIYHTYQESGGTTHIIASNLPNVKINKLGTIPIIKPGWISDSLTLGRLLDYRNYLLYTNQTRTQPCLKFTSVVKSDVKLGPPIAESTSNNLESIITLNGADFVSQIASTSKCALPAAPKKSDDIKIDNPINLRNVSNNSVNTGFKVSKTASDPKFLSEFYSNSRLHLIATLGAEFKQLVNEMREKKNWVFAGLERLQLTKVHSSISTPVIMHIDMDCFFVSVGLRSRPALRGKPVAVTHSKGGQSSSRSGVDRQAEIALYTERLPGGAVSRLDSIDDNSSLSEIASCSYEARRCGVKNGMFMGAALKLCPDLMAIPYDFQGYREVSLTLYQTIAEYTLNIEAVSCDEMYVDISPILRATGLPVEAWAEHIRGEIKTRTGCPCSTGFGSNRLQARLATKKAKPDGQYYLLPEDVEDYMAVMELSELPGVGRATLGKLRNLGFETCGDLLGGSLSILRKELGIKAGETIYEQAQGIDKKSLCYEHERKSVSAEVNYGIRFKTKDECLLFLESLAVEVHGRLVETGMRAKCITLKLMVRASEAPTETAKFLGHGVCDSLSRSSTLNTLMSDPTIIYKEVKSLYEKLEIPFEELRGLGIQLSRLEKGSVNTMMKKFLDGSVVLKKSNADQSVNKIKNDSINNINKSIEKVGINTKIERKSVRKLDNNKLTMRGRPKNSKNVTKLATKTNNDLSNYFKNTLKDRSSTKKNQYEFENNKGIDMEVLKELPEEIRNEVIREYQLKNINYSQTPSTSVKEKVVCNQEKPKDIPEKGREFHNLSYDDLKIMLKNWLQSESIPLDVDTAMLANFFKQLAIDRKIENLHMIVKFLHRNITAKNDCNWHDAYFIIIKALQDGMIIQYGHQLDVPIGFDCNKIEHKSGMLRGRTEVYI